MENVEVNEVEKTDISSSNEVEVIFEDQEAKKSSSVNRRDSSSHSQRISLDDEGPLPPIEVHLAAPEKVGEGIMNAHVEYKVNVKTSLPQYKSNDFSTVRRFKDFLWLREHLLEKHKGYLIPPLPEKQIINRFSAEFIEFRRRELEKFLYRIVSHPVLVQSPSLQAFLEAENSENLALSSKPQATKKEQEGKSGGGFLSMLGSSIETISSNFNSQSEPDHWFDAKKIILLDLKIN